MKLLLKYFFVCLSCSLLVLCCILFSAIVMLQKPKHNSETDGEFQRFAMKIYNNNLQKLSDKSKSTKEAETLRWQQVDETSLDQIRLQTFENCTKALKISEKLRKSEQYFLRIIHAKSVRCFTTVNFMLTELKVPRKEIHDFMFLQEVTWSELDNFVTSHIQILDELIVLFNITCQGLQSGETLLMQNTTALNQSLVELKELTARVIAQLPNRISDIKEMLVEFGEFAISMAQMADISDTSVELELKKVSKIILIQKAKIGGLHKILLKRRRIMLISFSNLVYKISGIKTKP